MAIQEKSFLLEDAYVAILQINTPFSDRFDLVTQKTDTGFIFIMDEVVEVRFPVLGYDLKGGSHGLDCGREFFFLFHR